MTAEEIRAVEPAAAYLEKLQKAVYEDRLKKPENPSEEWLADFSKKAQAAEAERLGGFDAGLEPMLGTVAAWYARRVANTEAIDKLWRPISDDLARDLDQAAIALHMTPPDHPVFGSLPLAQLNAMAVAVPEGAGALILFQTGLFSYLHLLSKVITVAMPIERRGENFVISSDPLTIVKHLRDHQEALLRLGQVLDAYLYSGSPTKAPQYFLDRATSFLGGNLMVAAERFVLGHEYGHLVNGDLGGQTTSACLVGPVEAVQIVQNHEKEFKADSVGLRLMLQAMQGYGSGLALAYAGAEFFFTGVEILERALTLAKFGRAAHLAGDSHPPVAARVTAIRQQLAAMFGESQSAAAVKFALQVTWLLNFLWESIAYKFSRFHSENRRLSPLWDAITLPSPTLEATANAQPTSA
jgi:hypothetical protein